MSDRKLKYLFNPDQKDPKTLKAEFVVRTAIFEQIFADIQEDTMQNPPQHYMLLGQRGMGKTTMLLRLKYAVLDDEKLSKWLLPILFNEEQYSMPDLASFFEHIAKLLAEDHPAYESLLEEMRKHEFEADYDQKAFEVLVEYLKKNEQKIIVFHDNFGQFLEKIGKTATHRLRNILMNSPYIRLIGASATLLEHTFDYKEPFFDFFYQIRLKGMTADETILLFEKLAENEGKAEYFAEILKTERPRIEVMRKLSGGVIRTMVMLFDVFIDNEKQDSFKDLEAILDRVTPLYKHRMDDLKPQQQLIVDAVARAWDAVTVSEIAELARSERQGLKTNQISAQLKQLVDNQVIEIEPRTTGRTHLYRLQERFFNIWYLMRYSTRQDKQRVIWLVRFLEGWCNTKDLKQLFERFDNNLEKGTYELSTVFDRALAYSMVENDEVLGEKIRVLSNAIFYLLEKQGNESDIFILKNRFDEISTDIELKSFFGIREGVKNNIMRIYSLYSVEKDSFIKEFLSIIVFTIYDYLNDEYSPKKENIQEVNFELVLCDSIINILINNIEEGIEDLEHIIHIYQYNYSKLSEILISQLLLLLIAKKQLHTPYKLFREHPELTQQLKPIYYLTMEYLKDEYPNDYLKAGEELRETIEELKERVKWFEENLS
ncbi:hypothetical protein GCM10011514_26350 [Emticicia aquatilis]|uniref:Uncharacterized protein n=1 Tax=Emticicia aquatilis TaxID=1537369 RepID=A0A916YUK5_9BACT|nr:hypothetical protein [Emticicia aquatilis]GGD61098.1 hypothetical protein GCM10011514_26350 [Emticicia aquatilis]